jgi:hypothetical protein
MSNQELKAFADAWHDGMFVAVIAMALIAILIFLLYHLKVSLQKSNKEKHDYINTFEIKRYKLVFVFLGLAAGFLINMYGRDEIAWPGVAFYVRIFFGIAGATMIIYISALVLDYYYPTIVNRKLRRLRFAPRTSSTGGKMKLLSEDEEDVHLNEGMQAEENIFSIDYDVWIDQKTNEIKIEKYQGHLISLECNNCGFYTMKVKQEEIIEKNEDGSPKEILKHYQCTYCKNVRATQFTVNRKEAEDYKHIKPVAKKSSKNIELVKIDLRSNRGTKKSFEFSTVDEAKKFLDEFDFGKVD